jgi:hypothetical protein
MKHGRAGFVPTRPWDMFVYPCSHIAGNTRIIGQFWCSDGFSGWMDREALTTP